VEQSSAVKPHMHKRWGISATHFRLWMIYSLGKSTAIVIPVLPIFVLAQQGLTVNQMLHVASYFLLVPLVLDIPAGWLSDRFGQRKTLIFGTVSFALAFVVLTFSVPHAYPAYLLLIGIAAACYSGSEAIYLKSILAEHTSLTSVISETNERVYLFSSVMLIVGGILYSISPLLPFATQIFLMAAAAGSLLGLPDGSNKPHISNSKPKNLKLPDEKMSIVFWQTSTLVVVYSGLFSGFVQLTSRTVQIQITDYLSTLPYIKLGILFAAGNFFSAAGSRFVRMISDLQTEEGLLISSAFLGGLSAWLLSSDSIICIGAGFFLLCVFKGFYRPPLTQLLQRFASSKRNQATTYSAANVAAMILAGLLHQAAAIFFDNVAKLYQSLAATLTILAVISLLIWIALSVIQFPLAILSDRKKRASGKQHK